VAQRDRARPRRERDSRARSTVDIAAQSLRARHAADPPPFWCGSPRHRTAHCRIDPACAAVSNLELVRLCASGSCRAARKPGFRTAPRPRGAVSRPADPGRPAAVDSFSAFRAALEATMSRVRWNDRLGGAIAPHPGRARADPPSKTDRHCRAAANPVAALRGRVFSEEGGARLGDEPLSGCEAAACDRPGALIAGLSNRFARRPSCSTGLT